VVEGTVGMKVGRKKIEARAGEVVTVEPGVAHKFWNAGDGEARFVCKVSPALGFRPVYEPAGEAEAAVA
jgi:quercetin dioxygenase-like cupin family protein